MNVSLDRKNWKNTGKAFEHELEFTCGAYARAGLATIKKVDPPTRIVGSGFRQKTIHLANPFLDYVGAWTERGGRALFIEGKSTSDHRLSIGRDGGLTEAQVAALTAWRRAGAASFVLWQYQGRVVLLSCLNVEIAIQEGKKSLAFDEGCPVPRGPAGMIWDFLSIVRSPSAVY